jgi:hypothetical protein
MITLLYRGVERVHVEMEDDAKHGKAQNPEFGIQNPQYSVF